jgi:hypothetical protein
MESVLQRKAYCEFWLPSIRPDWVARHRLERRALGLHATEVCRAAEMPRQAHHRQEGCHGRLG